MGPNSAVTVSPGWHCTTSAALPVVTTWPASSVRPLAPRWLASQTMTFHGSPRTFGARALAHHLAVHADDHRLAGEVAVEPARRRRPEAEQAADGVVADQVGGLHGEPVGVARIRHLDGGMHARDRRPHVFARIGRVARGQRPAHDEVELRLDRVEVHGVRGHGFGSMTGRRWKTDKRTAGTVRSVSAGMGFGHRPADGRRRRHTPAAPRPI